MRQYRMARLKQSMLTVHASEELSNNPAFHFSLGGFAFGRDRVNFVYK
jgi:hypothetical protein